MFKKISESLPDRPIFYELRQQLRRGVLTVNPGQKWAAVFVLLAILVPVAYLVFQSGAYISPQMLMFGVPPLMSMLLPAVVSPVIAGEYQRRSLEQLLASPLRPLHIVFAKALRGVIPAMMILVAVYGLSAVTVLSKVVYGEQATDNVVPFWISIVACTIISIGWAIFVVGSSIYISALARSTTAALLGSTGFQIAVFLVIPGIVIPLVAMASQEWASVFFRLHPLGQMDLAIMQRSDEQRLAAQITVAWISVIAYIGMGTAFLFLAARRLERYRRTGFENT